MNGALTRLFHETKYWVFQLDKTLQYYLPGAEANTRAIHDACFAPATFNKLIGYITCPLDEIVPPDIQF